MKISMKNELSEDAKNLYVFLVKILSVDLDLEDYSESSGEENTVLFLRWIGVCIIHCMNVGIILMMN